MTYIGFEGGSKWDQFQLTDYGGGLKYKPILGFKIGITAGHEFLPNMFFETGFYYNQLQESLRFIVMPEAYGTGTTNLLYELPLRFKYRYSIIKDKLSLTGNIGFLLAFNTDYRDEGYSAEGRIGLITSSDSVFYWSYDNYSGRKILSSAELGFSVDYKFKNNIIISLSNYYVLGLSKISTSDISYKVNDGAEQKAKTVAKGSAYNLLFSLKLPLSNIWDKTEEGLKQKENLKEKISKNKEKSFYFAAEVGISNPYYDEDNLFIAGKFIPDLLFHSSNLNYGILIGAKIYKEFFGEVGFYGNNFENQYVIYLDNSAFGSGFSGGTNYYSIPVNIKYRINLNDRFRFEPFIGTSVLFSRKKDLYDQSSSSGSNTTNGVTSYFTENSYAYRENNPVLTVTLGGGLEFAASENIILTLNASYEQGFKNFNRLNVFYQSDDVTETGNVFYKGSNFKMSAGVKVPIDFKKRKKMHLNEN